MKKNTIKSIRKVFIILFVFAVSAVGISFLTASVTPVVIVDDNALSFLDLNKKVEDFFADKSESFKKELLTILLEDPNPYVRNLADQTARRLAVLDPRPSFIHYSLHELLQHRFFICNSTTEIGGIGSGVELKFNLSALYAWLYDLKATYSHLMEAYHLEKDETMLNLFKFMANHKLFSEDSLLFLRQADPDNVYYKLWIFLY